MAMLSKTELQILKWLYWTLQSGRNNEASGSIAAEKKGNRESTVGETEPME